ncbi:hypothetical protein SVI_2375 [Shewanella violacea DSS12]|uniref:Uncharacterized protein n=1 Tax=Shewanella violacea (strain JCM 10179 / CIP 106290 / LMG 19151 / DSS12) TaxID=637905 RepID=D4ZKZ7_SHEVD|nr:hypothetical protein SVI_2375 [Shewanella violacea DSS12]
MGLYVINAAYVRELIYKNLFYEDKSCYKPVFVILGYFQSTRLSIIETPGPKYALGLKTMVILWHKEF